MLRALPVFALVMITLAFPAVAQEATPADALASKTTPAFQCTAASEGQLTCQANKQCKCGYRPAEAAIGLPARWAWDCGIMRPRCEVTPADTGDGAYALPPMIIEQGENTGDHKDDGGK